MVFLCSVDFWIFSSFICSCDFDIQDVDKSFDVNVAQSIEMVGTAAKRVSESATRNCYISSGIVPPAWVPMLKAMDQKEVDWTAFLKQQATKMDGLIQQLSANGYLEDSITGEEFINFDDEEVLICFH